MAKIKNTKRPFVLVRENKDGDYPDVVRTYATLMAARKAAKKQFLDINCGEDPTPEELVECGYTNPDFIDDGYTIWTISGPGL